MWPPRVRLLEAHVVVAQQVAPREKPAGDRQIVDATAAPDVGDAPDPLAGTAVGAELDLRPRHPRSPIHAVPPSTMLWSSIWNSAEQVGEVVDDDGSVERRALEPQPLAGVRIADNDPQLHAVAQCRAAAVVVDGDGVARKIED